MNVQALELPTILPALPMAQDRTPAFTDWRQQGMPGDGVVYVGYQATRFSQNYGADGRAVGERERVGSIIDIYV